MFQDIKAVEERIVDDISRDVFNMRLSYAFGDVDTYDFFDLVKEKKCTLYQSFYNWLSKDNSDKEHLVIFGGRESW